MNCRNRLREWITQNPKDWKTLSLREIASKTGMSRQSVGDELYNAAADLFDIMPSQAVEIRAKHRPTIGARKKDDIKKLKQFIRENPNMPIIDIAYCTNFSPTSVKKIIEKMQSTSKKEFPR